ncbi:MAG: hypothetical protein JWM14_2688 [Chitinophagaceae bacterium]|nr:hypothetical protein [Chitinophagaceae bacterium]
MILGACLYGPDYSLHPEASGRSNHTYLYYHTQRLAVGFPLLSLTQVSFIRKGYDSRNYSKILV